METISSIAVAARNSVFGEPPPSTKSVAEPPTVETSDKTTADEPQEAANVPEQVPTQLGTEPPSGGSKGEGTPEAPFDRGNEPEQIQTTSKMQMLESTTSETDPLPSNTVLASKTDLTDPSIPSNMKSPAHNHHATNSANEISSKPSSSTETESKSKKIGTAKPGSHSALFGLCAEGESSSDKTGTKSTIHPPKTSGEICATIDEAGELMGQQAEMEKRGTSEDDTGGYVGLKKAAMEEEEKKKQKEEQRNSSGLANGNGWAVATSNSTTAAGFGGDEEREPRPVEKKNSLAREISPGEMPDGTHRRSIVEGMPVGYSFGRKNTASNGEKSGGFREKLKDKFRSKK